MIPKERLSIRHAPIGRIAWKWEVTGKGKADVNPDREIKTNEDNNGPAVRPLIQGSHQGACELGGFSPGDAYISSFLLLRYSCDRFQKLRVKMIRAVCCLSGYVNGCRRNPRNVIRSIAPGLDHAASFLHRLS